MAILKIMHIGIKELIFYKLIHLKVFLFFHKKNIINKFFTFLEETQRKEVF